VSNSHEPSYYEIALTNRQVVVAFVVLLACLLTAFFSGVWVGRGSLERQRGSMVRSSPPLEQRAEGTALEELEFFDRQGGGEDASPAAEGGRAGQETERQRPTTLAEDLDGRAGVPPAGDQGATAAPPAAPPPAAGSPASPNDAPGNRAAERERRAEAPAPAAPTSPAGAEPADGAVVIQVFATPDRTEAERVQGRLQRGGQRAFLSPVTVEGRTLYRVRVGPFGTRGEAQRVAETVRKTYRLDTWVTQ
jgi:DedD protein